MILDPLVTIIPLSKASNCITECGVLSELAVYRKEYGFIELF